MVETNSFQRLTNYSTTNIKELAMDLESGDTHNEETGD